MSSESKKPTSILKIIATDLAGITCIILVPILGPLPGPGGIPLLLSGLGLLAVNHEFARRWLHYAKKHSKSITSIAFPDITLVKWAWDMLAVSLLLGGLLLSFRSEWWLFRGLSIGIMATSSTIFMLNRNRIAKLDSFFRHRSVDDK